MPQLSEAARSRSPKRQADIVELLEVTQLCTTLEAQLQTALGKAGGDASRVVLVLDMDETCFTPLTDDGLATSVWFEDIVKRWSSRLEEAEGMTYIQTLQAILALVDGFYPRVRVGLTESALPALLRKYKALGVASVGLTARRPQLASATFTQMGTWCDLEFDSLAPSLDQEAIKSLDKFLRTPDHVGNPACWNGISCEGGVWFTANANKGSVLRALLEPGKHVVFADDSLRHVKAVNTSLRGHADSVSSIHFVAAVAAAKKRLDYMSCDRAVARHAAALFAEGDPIVVELVNKRDAFLRHFIADQLAIAGKTKSQEHSSLNSLAQALSGQSAAV